MPPLWSQATVAVEPAEPSVRTPNLPVAPEFAVYPPEILLGSARDFSVVYRSDDTRDDGVTLDISDRVQWTIAGNPVAKVEGQSLVPLADGEAVLVGTYNGTERKIPVRVAHATERFPISFEKDVMPVLTRTGCNTGSCHGAARGKDGFRTSLFGFDPVGDYTRITREIGVRRINLAMPERKLVAEEIDRQCATLWRQAFRCRQHLLQSDVGMAAERCAG